MPLVAEESSRYYTSPVVVFNISPETARPVVTSYLRPDFQVSGYKLYFWSENDRIDWMAAKKYGDPRYWWVIADANPAFNDWGHIPVGSVLKVPDYVPSR